MIEGTASKEVHAKEHLESAGSKSDPPLPEMMPIRRSSPKRKSEPKPVETILVLSLNPKIFG